MHSYPLNYVKNHPSSPIYLKDCINKTRECANIIHLEDYIKDSNWWAYKVSVKDSSLHKLSNKINSSDGGENNNYWIKSSINNNSPANNIKNRITFYNDSSNLLSIKDSS